MKAFLETVGNVAVHLTEKTSTISSKLSSFNFGVFNCIPGYVKLQDEQLIDLADAGFSVDIRQQGNRTFWHLEIDPAHSFWKNFIP